MAVELVNQSPNHQHYRELSLDATTTTASTGIDTSPWTSASYQIVWSGITAGVATYEIQSSLDGGTSWDAVTGSSDVTAGAAGSASEVFGGNLPGGLLRLKITATTGTAGVLNFYLVAKAG